MMFSSSCRHFHPIAAAGADFAANDAISLSLSLSLSLFLSLSLSSLSLSLSLSHRRQFDIRQAALSRGLAFGPFASRPKRENRRYQRAEKSG
jgi:hypothetical protein